MHSTTLLAMLLALVATVLAQNYTRETWKCPQVAPDHLLHEVQREEIHSMISQLFDLIPATYDSSSISSGISDSQNFRDQITRSSIVDALRHVDQQVSHDTTSSYGADTDSLLSKPFVNSINDLSKVVYVKTPACARFYIAGTTI